MRASARWLTSLDRVLRSKSTSFIGLGNMGTEMATNLFSKQFANSVESRFIVCDAVPETALSFARKFGHRYPGANITIASTPEEYVRLNYLLEPSK